MPGGTLSSVNDDNDVAAKRISYLAPFVVTLWLIATASGRFFDVRLSIAVVAIGAAAVCVFLLPEFFRRLFAPRPTHIIVGLSAAVVMVIATYTIFPILARIDPTIAASTRSLYSRMRVPHATATILVIVGIIVVAEEILWRGVVQEAFWLKYPSIMSALPSAVVYGLSHAPIGSPLLTIVAVLCGVYWSLLRHRTGSLLPSLIAHLIWDAAILTHPLISP